MPIADKKEYRDKTLRCPFCLAELCGITPIKTPFGSTVDGGKCACGGVFVYDRSGRMLGEAFSDALAFAFDWDYDAAYESGEEYEEAVVHYNNRIAKYLLGECGPLDRTPQYYFVRRVRKS